MNIAALEAKLAEYAGDFPALADKLTKGIQALKASRLESFIESRWPGAKSIEDSVLADLAFLSQLDADLIGWLNVLFPKPVA